MRKKEIKNDRKEEGRKEKERRKKEKKKQKKVSLCLRTSVSVVWKLCSPVL